MSTSRSKTTSHAPPRVLGGALALLIAIAAFVAACGSGGASQGVGGETGGPGETMGLESPAGSGY